MTDSEASDPEVGVVTLRVDWGDGPEGATIQFSDQIVASYRGDYVIITFGQVAQPQFLPGDDHAIAKARVRGVIPIRTQFRTAVPTSTFAEFLRGITKVARVHGVSLPEEDDNQ